MHTNPLFPYITDSSLPYFAHSFNRSWRLETVGGGKEDVRAGPAYFLSITCKH